MKRQRLSARKRATRLSLAATLVVIAATVGVNVFGGSSPDRSHQLTAMFTDASPLTSGNNVEIDGVKVGTIDSLSVDHGVAKVVMDLDASAMPIHSDATATIRPVSLLGERYVDLNRGTASKPVLAGGSVLPTSQTSQSTDLDQVLDTLDDPTGESLSALVTMLGEGSSGNGANIAATIKALAPTLTQTSKLATILNQQNHLLTSTLDAIQPVAGALATDKGKQLGTLVTSTTQLLDTTAANEQALQQLIGQLPQTLATARSTLADLAGTANAATPTLQSIRPATDNLQQISSEIENFTAAANPALTSAAPVLAKAQSLLTDAQPVVRALAQAGPSLLTDAKASEPLVAQLTSNVANVFNFIKYWALATNGYDGISHYFRAMLVVTPLSVTGLVPGLGGNLGVGGKVPVVGNQTTTAKPAPATKSTGLGSVLSQIPIVGGLLSPKTSTDGGVTGLTKKQELGGLLSLLGLGGN